MMVGAFVAQSGAATKACQETGSTVPSIVRAQEKQTPNEAIFNTQFMTAGKRFLTKIKKNRAMQVDRRTRGFQLGCEQRTVVLNPFTGSHYRVMLVDLDMQRREHLADTLEQCFEIFVASSNERAFALLRLFEIHFVMLRLDIGNDQTAASSPALTFLQEMKRSCFRTPVVALVDSSFNTDREAQKLLARALQQGGVCGYFEEGLLPDMMAERITKILRSLAVAQNEITRCHGAATQSSLNNQTTKVANSIRIADLSPLHQQHDNQLASKAQLTPQDPVSGLNCLSVAELPITHPNSVTFDRPGILLELRLNQRKQCTRQREVLQTTLASASHSVLGVDIDPSRISSDRPATSSMACISPSLASVGHQIKVKKTISPLPSTKQVSQLIHTRPQDLQTQIGRHLYEREYITGPPSAVPQDPLLNHCVVIDPRSQGRDLLVGKAYMLYCEQRLDESLLHCDRALRTPNSTLEKLARLLRGALYDARGEHTRAEAEFIACIQLDPSMHEAHFNLSVAQLKLGKDASALQALTQALALDPQNDKYLQNRGLMYRRMGYFAQAQTEYSKRELTSGTAPASSSARRAYTTKSRKMPGKLRAKASSRSASVASVATPQATRDKLSKCEVEDGMFTHLFGKPTPDKLALACPAIERSNDMLSAIVARLQTHLFFQDFSREMLTQVARALDYDVVACGKRFVLGKTHSHNFYVLLGGKLSVRKRVGTIDFGSTVTTHHLRPGSVFGCAGFTISAQASLIADECTEIGILWPDDYAATIRAVTSQANQDFFAFFQQIRGFRHLSTSELGHIVGISERKRFRKDDIVLEQNEQPRHLIILWKGSCAVYQDFGSPPLGRRKAERSAEDDDSDSDDSDDDVSNGNDLNANTRKARWQPHHGDEGVDDGPLPFHHFIAKPDWPLGFQTRSRARKHQGGRRAGLLPSQTAQIVIPERKYSTLILPLPTRRLKDKLAPRDKNALIMKCRAPAVFGESGFLNSIHTSSKCCVVAESLVEVLLLDHIRLQEMELQPEVISELFDIAPKYQSEKETAQKRSDVATWEEYRNLCVLELSKKRWPEAKARANAYRLHWSYLLKELNERFLFLLAVYQKHLRALSNGCSIMLTGIDAS